jgi:hypothetical protein
MGVLGLSLIVIFWLVVAGPIEAGFIAVVIVLAILLLNRTQKGEPTELSP